MMGAIRSKQRGEGGAHPSIVCCITMAGQQLANWAFKQRFRNCFSINCSLISLVRLIPDQLTIAFAGTSVSKRSRLEMLVWKDKWDQWRKKLGKGENCQPSENLFWRPSGQNRCQKQTHHDAKGQDQLNLMGSNWICPNVAAKCKEINQGLRPLARPHHHIVFHATSFKRSVPNYIQPIKRLMATM